MLLGGTRFPLVHYIARTRNEGGRHLVFEAYRYVANLEVRTFGVPRSIATIPIPYCHPAQPERERKEVSDHCKSAGKSD
jgi:hypothetical protein